MARSLLLFALAKAERTADSSNPMLTRSLTEESAVLLMAVVLLLFPLPGLEFLFEVDKDGCEDGGCCEVRCCCCIRQACEAVGAAVADPKPNEDVNDGDGDDDDDDEEAAAAALASAAAAAGLGLWLF